MLVLMELCLELMASIFVLVTQPFCLMKLACLFGMRTVHFLTCALLQLMKAIVNFHLDLCWKIMIWTIAFFSLPYRILIAIQRERLLEMLLVELQIELENLAWDKKELEERLHTALKNCRFMESTLAELEEEHDEALEKIEQLENELQDLKNENLWLKETQVKELNNFTSCNDPSQPNVHDELLGFPMKDEWKNGSKGTSQIHHLLKIGQTGSKTVCSISSESFPRRLPVEKVLDHCRRLALSHSLFGAILSLLVGMIIWAAEDPCLPLVLGLYAVVGLSLKSVIYFFSTINIRPATDAVALLSFNWFILGTLTYPTLPRVTHMLAPLVQRCAN